MALKVSKKVLSSKHFKDKGVSFKIFSGFCQKFGIIDIYPPFPIHVADTWLHQKYGNQIETQK